MRWAFLVNTMIYRKLDVGWGYKFKFWSRFCSQVWIDQDFEVKVFWKCRCLVEILKLMLGRYSEDEFWSKVCVRTCGMNSTLGSVVPLAMFLSKGHSPIHIIIVKLTLIQIGWAQMTILMSHQFRSWPDTISPRLSSDMWWLLTPTSFTPTSHHRPQHSHLLLIMRLSNDHYDMIPGSQLSNGSL